MTDPNPESNANANEDVANQMTGQTNSNGASTSTQRATSIQTGPNAHFSETHHITSDRGRPSTLSTDNQCHLRLGNTRPWPSDYTVGLNQGGQGSARIAQPSDSIQPVTITWLFSTTITEYFPTPRESRPVEDSQPHTMPVSIMLNNIGRSRLVRNENSHPNTGETTQNIRDEISTPSVHIEPVIQVFVVGNAAPGIPNEISRDFEFSVITNERQNGNEADASSDDEQRLLHESLQHVRSGNRDDLTGNIDHRGEVLPNTEIIVVVDQNQTSPNQTNVVDEQAVTTTLATDSHSSQIREDGRNVDAPTEAGQQMICTATDSVINNVTKQRTPSSSSDESVEEAEHR